MPNYTVNYALPLPLPEEYYNIEVVNEVTTQVDDQLKQAQERAEQLQKQAEAMEERLEELRESVGTGVGASLEELRARVAENGSKIATLWDAVFSDITGNPFSIVFSSLEGVTVTAGVYNAAQKRLEC